MPRRHKYKQEKLLKQKEKQATKKVNKTKPQKSASAKPSAPYTDQTEKDDIQNYGIVVFVTDITMTTIVMTMTDGDAKLFFMRNVQGFGNKSDLKHFMSENCKSEENL